MPRRLLRLADSVNPAQVGLAEADLAVRALRLGSLLSALLVPLFGILYRSLGVDMVDPVWPRAALTGLAVAFFGLSYVSPMARRHALALFQGMTLLLLVYLSATAVTNGFSGDAATGLLFSFAIISMGQSLAYTRVRPYGISLIVSTTIVVGAAAAAPEAAVSRALFCVSVVSVGMVKYLVVAGRLRFQEARSASERRLAEAEHLARTGSWTFDPQSGHRTWSDGLYRLTGLAPGTAPPPLTSLAHPDDRDEATAARLQVLASATSADMELRIVTADGETRAIRMVIRTEPDRTGTAAHVTGAVVDVTEQVAREAALRDALDRAEEGTRAKSAFLANMSHEIRTPLTAILGFAQLLGEETGDAYRDLVEPIEAGGARLLGTLNSVLDFARMEAGHADLAVEPVDAAAEVRAAVHLLGGQAAGKGFPLTADVPDAPLWVLADRGALGRALANLVSNAVKFTHAGRVTVSAAEAPDGGVEIAVADTGCGMPTEFLSRLYEPFQQASTGWARSHEGNGLGLTITRRLVEGMGGTIAVESAPGQGTRFTVALPAAERPTEAPLHAQPVSVRERAAV